MVSVNYTLFNMDYLDKKIDISGPLLPTESNCPTRVGEIVENVSDIYNIPSPRLGMQVFVKSEKKSFVITSLKNKVIGGVDVPEAAVEAFEAVGAKSITWNNDTDPSNMNDFTIAGVYDIKGERTRDDDNLPVLNTGGGHSFNARLTVLDSSITGDGKNDDKCITQVMSFNNRLGQGEVYIRTGKGASLDNLTWEKWSTLQRNVNVEQVYTLNDLIDNGIYSGVYVKNAAEVETFVMVVINNYAAASQTSMPKSISQFKYSVSLGGSFAKYETRVGTGVNDWNDWEILNKDEITSMISAEIKKVTDGIDPKEIDSIKDIVAWINAHGGEVTAIYNAITAERTRAIGQEGLLNNAIAGEKARAEQTEQAIDDKIDEEINRSVAADQDLLRGIDEEARRATEAEGKINQNTIAVDSMSYSTTTDDMSLEFETLDGKSGSVTFPTATTENAGIMSAVDKAKLNASIKDVDVAPSPNDVELDLEDNTDKITHVVFPAATTESAGVMSADDKLQLIEIESAIRDKKIHLKKMGYYRPGGYVSNDYTKNTGLVYFKVYSSITCTSSLAGDSYVVAFFDADGNLLEDISIEAGVAGWLTRNIDLTNEEYAAAEYLAVSCYDDSSAFTQFSAVLESPDSIEQRLMQMENIPIPKSDEIFEKRPQLVDYGYYGTNGGKTNTNNAMNTGIVSVDGYKKIEYNTKLSSEGAEIVFYDKSKNFIEGLSISGRNSLDTNTVDLSDAKYANVGYIIISYYDGTGKYAGYNARLYSDNTLETRVAGLERIEAIMPSTDRPLNILIFGDSITDSTIITVNEQQQTTLYNLLEKGGFMFDETGANVRISMWPYLITKYLPCHDVRDYAKSGASYTEKAREAGNERQNLSYQIQLALNDKSNPNGVFPTVGDFIPDVIIFALGTNDGAPNDTYDSAMAKTVMSVDGKSFDVEATLSNLDLTNTCEAIRYAFLKVKSAFPQSLCFCVLPIQRAGSEKPGINDALEKMARRYSIKVIDGAAELGVVRDLEVSNGSGACLKDGLHPNDKGHKLYARMMVNAIKNNYIDMSLMG